MKDENYVCVKFASLINAFLELHFATLTHGRYNARNWRIRKKLKSFIFMIDIPYVCITYLCDNLSPSIPGHTRTRSSSNRCPHDYRVENRSLKVY